jgi:branched-chain amino acid transport system ATP-binding protein
MSGEPVVQVENLDVYYGTSQILFGVGLSVRQGETMALLGRNGAGKSTTMKAIMGLAPARRGRVTLHGKLVSGMKPHRIARAGLGFVPEDRQIFPEHTVEDNLVIGAKKGPNGEDEWPIRRIYDVFPLLEPLRYRIAGRLSGGEQQMLAIGRGMASAPRLLLLDEPSMGLAPTIADLIFDRVAALHRDDRLTILLVEQRVAEALESCDYGYVLETGRVVLEGPHHALMADDRVRRAYLGM